MVIITAKILQVVQTKNPEWLFVMATRGFSSERLLYLRAGSSHYPLLKQSINKTVELQIDFYTEMLEGNKFHNVFHLVSVSSNSSQMPKLDW